ncbi:hypothetical protein L3Q82_006183 [Scortum barcoo]|uniref:Uncharacterized protein n=1 Tax=Scortum barcoo TaxID=214431 RepID=A0ACB8X5Y0_9TELE|nr:hypothetical protein L3Q82_006183 [Scortum barcoo]
MAYTRHSFHKFFKRDACGKYRLKGKNNSLYKSSQLICDGLKFLVPPAGVGVALCFSPGVSCMETLAGFLILWSEATSERIQRSTPSRDYGGESQLNFRFLGVYISEDLTWTHHTDFITKCTIESILTGCITAWYSSCTALNHKALQRVVKAAQHITRMDLPSMEEPLHPAV